MSKPETDLIKLPSGALIDVEDIQYAKPDPGKSPYVVVFHNAERLFMGEADRDALLKYVSERRGK